MSRARWLQETRQMRFEDLYERWYAKRLTQEDAAQLLGVCERTFRRHTSGKHRRQCRRMNPGKLTESRLLLMSLAGSDDYAIGDIASLLRATSVGFRF